MTNVLDSGLTNEQANLAKSVLEALELNHLRVTYFEGHLKFAQDRREVDVPLELIKEGNWIDIRFLFRAILGNSQAVWNRGARNVWDEKGPNYYHTDED